MSSNQFDIVSVFVDVVEVFSSSSPALISSYELICALSRSMYPRKRSVSYKVHLIQVKPEEVRWTPY